MSAMSLRVLGRLAAGLMLVLAGCSSGPKYKPVDIPSVPVVQDVKQVWSLALGAVPETLVPAVQAGAGQGVSCRTAGSQEALLEMR